MISKNTVRGGTSLVAIAINSPDKVAVNLDSRISTQIRGSLPLSIDIWDVVARTVEKVEKKVSLPFHLHHDKKFYALDPILVGAAFGFDASEIKPILALFTLYYLEVHLIDDLIEDQGKFYSKFKNGDCNTDGSFKAASSLFTLVFNLASTELIRAMEIDGAAAAEMLTLLNRSLLSQIRHFVVEKDTLNTEQVLEAKMHKVAGPATAMLADMLNTKYRFDRERFRHLKESLFYLGSLTQFTDDIRDRGKDAKTGNANLLLSLERDFSAGVADEFETLYKRDEELMLECAAKTGLQPDCDLLRAIPWHPFVVKPLIRELL